MPIKINPMDLFGNANKPAQEANKPTQSADNTAESANNATESTDNITESANTPICASEKNCNNLTKDQIEVCKSFGEFLYISSESILGNTETVESMQESVIDDIKKGNAVIVPYDLMRGLTESINETIDEQHRLAAERNRLRRELADSRKREEYALAQLSEAQRQALASSSGEEAYKRWKAQQGRGKPKAVIDWEAYDHLRAAKLNAKQIANALGVSPNTLRARLKERSGAQPKDEPFDAAREL